MIRDVFSSVVTAGAPQLTYIKHKTPEPQE